MTYIKLKSYKSDVLQKLIQEIEGDAILDDNEDTMLPVASKKPNLPPLNNFITEKLHIGELDKRTKKIINQMFSDNPLGTAFIYDMFKQNDQVNWNLVDDDTKIELTINQRFDKVSQYIVYSYDFTKSGKTQDIVLQDNKISYFIKVVLQDTSLNLPTAYKEVLPKKDDGYFDDEILINLVFPNLPGEAIKIYIELDCGNNDNSFRAIRITNNQNIKTTTIGQDFLFNSVRVLLKSDNEISKNSTFGAVCSKAFIELSYIDAGGVPLFLVNTNFENDEYSNILARKQIRLTQNLMVYSTWYAKGTNEVPSGGLRYDPQMTIETNRYINSLHQIPTVISSTSSVYTTPRFNEYLFNGYTIVNPRKASNVGLLSNDVPDKDVISYLNNTELNQSVETGVSLAQSSGMGNYKAKNYFTSRKLFFCDWFIENGIIKKRNTAQSFTFGIVINDIDALIDEAGYSMNFYFEFDIYFAFRFPVEKTDQYSLRIYKDALVSIDNKTGLIANENTPFITQAILPINSSGNASGNYLDLVISEGQKLRWAFKYSKTNVSPIFWFTP